MPTTAPVDHELDHEMNMRPGPAQDGSRAESRRRTSLAVVLIPPPAGFYSYFSGIPLHLLAKKEEDKETSEESAAPSIKLVSDRAHTLEVSDEVVTTLGIRKGDRDSIAVAQPPTKMRPLVLPGSTAIVPARLARIRPRFAPARVVELAQVRIAPPRPDTRSTAS